MNGISNISTQSDYRNLASGKRINTAADGAADLSIIEEQTKQIKGYDAGSRNIESGKDALNISDAALGNITDYLQRMRELAVQAKNGFLSDSGRSAIQKEVDQLKQGIANIADQTDYNGKKLLDGSNTAFSMVTSSKGNEVSISAGDATLAALGIKDFDVTGNFNLDTIDRALDKVTEQRKAEPSIIDLIMRLDTMRMFLIIQQRQRANWKILTMQKLFRSKRRSKHFSHINL